MDDALVQSTKQVTKGQLPQVLILVVMDDALVPLKPQSTVMMWCVLILVVMDDALVLTIRPKRQ